jgi:hypothetical protein
MENKKVFIIKTVHSVLFFLLVFSLFYTLYAAIARNYNWLLLASMVVIVIDGLAIALNRQRCPLTTLAERYGARDGAVTNIFLPGWAARYVFKFFTVLFIVEFVILGIGYF